eukprot:CAMPEP_0194288046 /NCGR_PEP_ID=MMETSP0169-20130528/36007_1 /TAXON_ID=218684 /ORGANISM="Corethron pennatum, Strain L29A3" /LENGTH=119 /DNA_ID=CAMNT_0039034929 /DNA_START=621 /DNA_END=981 /DNA_ORIENTATION=-
MPPSVWPCAVRVSERRTRHTAIDVEDLPPPTVRARDAVRCGVEAEDLVRCARASLGCGRGGNRVALYEGALLHGVRNLCAASILAGLWGDPTDGTVPFEEDGGGELGDGVAEPRSNRPY